jgi:transposase-like protein
MKPFSQIKTLQAAIQYFSDEQVCVDAVAQMRWPDGKAECPMCGGIEHYYLASRYIWKCKACKKQFSVKVGTVMEDSPIPLHKWLLAMWMIGNCRNGVSSYEVHRAIGVSQKSAWFMLQRIRLAMRADDVVKIGGEGSTCEADETVIGGKLKYMHVKRKNEMGMAGSGAYNRNKTVVMGVLDRNARKVRASVIPFAGRAPMEAMVRKHVEPGTMMHTDAHVGYDRLKNYFPHEVINHMEAYVRGQVTTNGIENFWSLLKRGLGGTYVAVEPFHLHRYVDEQVFRYNHRKDGDVKLSDGDRFQALLAQVAGKRLTWAEVTGKVGETAF